MNRLTPNLLRGAVLIACACALLFLLSPAALAQHAAKGDAPGDGASAGASGQQVAVDAKTGKLRKPTPEEIQQLVSGFKSNNDSAEGLTAKRVGNSSVVMDLEGRFETVAIAKINPDGTLSTACVVSSKQAEAFLNSDTSKAKQQKAKTDPAALEVK